MIEINNWHIRNDNPVNWRIEDQELLVQVSEGNIWGAGSSEVDNMFIHPTKPDSVKEKGNFSAQVAINLTPKRTYEQGGLGIIWDTDNYIKISKEMFNGKLSLVFVIEKDGHPSIQQLIDYSKDDVVVKIEKRDNLVTASYAEFVGDKWTVVGTADTLDGEEEGLMLYTFGGSKTAPSTARFSNFVLASN
ncbi:DUF1349 domain-containing protein [Photobacterium rosenbergii]|uniref:DUF1349 domain-containing protein n=1 Tax=Photobacterium rosenbergii TaxID=294936 RepID=UPI001C99BF46|nr:DUF1349 domain-containing protein [Photobacterium rosenbergii]MBY5946869.1 DUF1349 domain-containing protein [Photobacterium rosenbergii]